MEQTENKTEGENLDIAMEVNMDALVDGDAGVSDIDASIPGTNERPPQTNDMPDPSKSTGDNYITQGGLENLDEKMDQELGVENNNIDNIDEGADYDSDNRVNEQSTSNEEYEEVAYYNAPFDELRERLGDDFQMPEDINEENYMDKLLDVIYKNTNFEEYVHPEVRDLNNYLKDGGNFENFMKDYKGHIEELNLTNADLVKTRLKQDAPDWSDDKINSVVQKMDNSGILDVEAERIRKNIKASKAEIHQRHLENNRSQREASLKEMKEQRARQINEAVEAFDKLDNVYGLPVSKAERQEFRETFTNLVTPDDSGAAPLYRMLQSNDNIAKIAYILSKGDSAVRSALTNAKESTKESFIDKLDPTPRTTSKSGQYEPGQINLDALSAPERARY
tara:strand:+ start:13286 stop:14464 length:1179 start_codon:yes stop_codon:yes gene_type:complete